MKESDIRPLNLFEQYLKLSAQDAQVYFLETNRTHIACPACASSQVQFAFKKNGFDFQECEECQSLFQSPRPALEDFSRFYADSPSSNFWANEFFPSVAERRRKLIFAPRAATIVSHAHQRNVYPKRVIDVGAGYGSLLEELKKVQPDLQISAIEPSKKLAEICRVKGIEVLETVLENAQAWKQSADLVTCFEVFEHVHNPLVFIRGLYDLLVPGGHVIVGCLGADGFDIQVLWEKSKSISPPHHINFLSREGFLNIFDRCGFTDIQVTTPGKLDVDIVQNASLEDESIFETHRFVNVLFKRDSRTLAAFQDFLAENQLSSHVWIIAKKPQNLTEA